MKCFLQVIQGHFREVRLALHVLSLLIVGVKLILKEHQYCRPMSTIALIQVAERLHLYLYSVIRNLRLKKGNI